MKLLLFLPLGLLLATAGHAATTFVTNTSGNAAALQGDGAGDTANLNLSVADGGGTITITTIGAFNGNNTQTLGMDGASMGVGNNKWGNTSQRWLFSFDQEVDFNALGFFGSSQGMKLESVAWKDDATASGANWNFSSNGSVGTFTFNSANGPTFDFTSAAVSSVPAGTELKIEHTSGSGGAQMGSFTITPVFAPVTIPEPSAALPGALALLLLVRRRRG